VEVTFRKLIEQRCSYWVAVRGKRTVVPGTAMALGRGDMPHDLTQLVVEAGMGLQYGFWGCVAAGATFKSTGRKRTKPGRAIIAQHQDELRQTELITSRQVALWKAGHDTPVTRELGRMASLWDSLDQHDELVVDWPSLRAEVRTPARV
jgi:hypothetical protein